jgi:serine/threonine protein kinase/WD40 repeat protein
METRVLTHPSADKLRGFGIGQLDDADAVAVMSHLDSCTQCQKAVAAVTSDYFLDRLREARSRSGTPLPGKSLSELARSLYGTIPPSTSAPAVSDLPPELANHPQYELVSELGRGGMGVVYLARHRLSGRPEVLKVMNKELMVRSGSKERFLREIKSAAMLDHPNVVKMYTAMEMGDLMVLVMEYVKGEDLAKLVKVKGRLPVPNACFYAQQTALGLQHAFDKKMVHRDIKPLNLMLAKEGKKHIVKVLDFGLAKVARETGEQFELTGSGQMLGTPDYVAPEQTLDATNADIRADIYSLGCTLYYLLAGRAPFKGKSLFEILQAHQSMEAKPLNQERPDVPEEVAAIVAKMMAKDPARRFQQPKEVAQALAPFFRADAKRPTAKLSQDSMEVEVIAPAQEVKESKPGKSTVPAPAFETLTESGVPSSKTANSKILCRKSAQSAPVARKKLLIGVGVLTGVLLVGFLGLLASGVLKVKTPDGTIVLENLPPDSEVTVDGNTVSVTSSDGKTFEVRIEPGKKHRLEVKRDGVKVFGEEVEVEADVSKPVVVRWERPQTTPTGQDTVKPGAALVIKRFPAEIWAPEQAKWRIEGDELVQSSIQLDTGITFGDAKWVDYDFSVDAKMVEGRPGFSLNFRKTDTNNYVFAVDEAYNVSSILRTSAGNKWADQSYHHVEPRSFVTEQWYHLEVRVRGQHYDAFIDGKKIFTFTADDLPPKGGVGLATWKTSCRFRNIVVKDPKGTILLEGLPEIKELPPKREPPPKPETQGFVPLFNGKDLTGWKTPFGGAGDWKAQDGMIVSNGPTSHLFSERGDYDNFHLRAEAQINDGGNSGLYFRTALGTGFPKGYEAQINATHGDPQKTGSLYNIAKILDQLHKPDDWFTLEVIAEGDHIVILVNDKKVVDVTDPTYKKGHIALQQHDKKTVVKFRKIEIKELLTKQSSNQVLEGHQASVRHLLFTPDGSRLISASNSNHVVVVKAGTIEDAGNDNTVRVWNVGSGQQIREFLVNEGRGYAPQGVAVSPDGRFVAACTSWEWGRPDGKSRLFLWDIASAMRLHHFLLPDGHAMRAVGFSADGKMLYAVRSGKGLHSWSMPDGKEVGTIDRENQAPNEAPFATTFTPGCRYVLGGVWNGMVRLWDRDTGKEVTSFKGHTKVPTAVAMSPNGTRILSSAGDFSVRMWETESGRQVFCLDNLDSNVLSVAFSSDGKRFLTGGEDGIVRMRDAASGKELASFTGHKAKVNCVAFSPNGQLAASGSDDKSIRLWKLTKE